MSVSVREWRDFLVRVLLVASILLLQPGCLAYNKTLYAPTDAETRLIKTLLLDYDKRVRPIQITSGTLQISFGISLKALLFLNEKYEYMETVSYMLTAWHDGRLMWNASEYMGIDSIKIPASDIWKPDIVPLTRTYVFLVMASLLLNILGMMYLIKNKHGGIDEDIHLMDTLVAVYASGHVSWIPTLYLRSSCSVSLRAFPFDMQKCTITFASYFYHGDHLNITFYGDSPESAFSLNDYVDNTNWQLMDHKVTINVIKYPCCPEPYQNIQFELLLKRNSEYYVHLFLLPAIFLGFLVPVTLLMPPESKERLTIGCIIMLCIILLKTKLCDVLPLAHNQLPALSMYYTLTLLWTALSLTGSVFVLNLHNRGPRRSKVPEIVRWIFLRSLKRLVCLGNDSYYPLTDLDTISMRGLDKSVTSQERQGTNADLRGANYSRLDKEVEEVNRNVNLLNARLSLQEARQDVLNEWRQVALVVDRVMFLLFLLVFLMCSVVLLA